MPLASITNLNNLDAAHNATIGEEPLFFSYSLESLAEPENQLLLLNVSNRTKLQVYLHLHPFPDETSHHYPLGDVPQKALKDLFNTARKMQIFEDSSPYIYDEKRDTVVYRQDFGHLNPEAIYPEATDHIDGLRIAKVTTWNLWRLESAGPPELANASGFNLRAGEQELPDRIDFLFWAKTWFCNPVVQIGVYNS